MSNLTADYEDDDDPDYTRKADCAVCGDTFPTGEMHQDDDGKYYCDDCWPDVEYDLRRAEEDEDEESDGQEKTP